MNKCLRITLSGDLGKNFSAFIQKSAKKFSLEGTFQFLEPHTKVKIIACGKKEELDEFLDFLHESDYDFDDILIEPFLKEKDYRGVFRIIE